MLDFILRTETVSHLWIALHVEEKPGSLVEALSEDLTAAQLGSDAVPRGSVLYQRHLNCLVRILKGRQGKSEESVGLVVIRREAVKRGKTAERSEAT